VIAILVPVLRRPSSAAPLAASLAEATTVPHRLVFVCNSSDREQVRACEDTGADIILAPWQPGKADWARKINLAYRLTEEPYLLLGADDLRFHPGWDMAALGPRSPFNDPAVGVVGTNDLGNPTVKAGKHSTHPIVRRSYADEHGTVDGPRKAVSEAYWHNWCDTELVQTAKARSAWAFCPESRVEHLHWAWHKGADDEVYALGRQHYADDARLYRRRQKLWARERRAVA
jgi:hypothetical protein